MSCLMIIDMIFQDFFCLGLVVGRSGKKDKIMNFLGGVKFAFYCSDPSH